MAIVVEFIKDYAAWVYGACALVALWYLRVALLARHARRYAVFSMEREAALNRTYGAWSVAFALIVVMSAVYFLSTVVSPAMQPLIQDGRTAAAAQTRVVFSPTPALPEDTATPAPQAATAAPAKASPSPKPTLKVAPTATPALSSPTPAPPAVQAPRCTDPNAAITAPGLNAEVSGLVPIMGTAVRPNFKYYKLELGSGANPGTWSYFDGGEHPVQGGRLGTLNASVLAHGVYSIRVVVVDATGNYTEQPCQTVITVK